MQLRQLTNNQYPGKRIKIKFKPGNPPQLVETPSLITITEA
jgi:hypothetical protein